MKKILVFLFLLLSIVSKAQNCGFDHLLEEMMSDPAKKAMIEKNIAKMSQPQTSTEVLGGASPLFIIPVVVHIVHDGGISNISDAQVLDAIEKLNEDFKKLSADTSSIVGSFQSIAGDARFEFRLATLDPNGNCTKGITRTLSYLTNVGSGEPIKDIIGWDTKNYYNVWVVNYLESGGKSVGGYSYWPGTAPDQKYEGTILINRQFGSIGTSYGVSAAARTLSHETGHFFGLNHTWGSGPIGVSCNGSDGINDTPPTKGSNGICDLAQNLCGGLENVQNIMDYSTCPIMFTQGQISYMRAAAASSVGYRSSLSSNGNLIATGAENNHVVYECSPKPVFEAHNDSTFFCAGRTISFADLSYNDSLSSNRIYEWTFEGGTPANSNLAKPYVTYAAAGTYDVKLKISNGNGADSVVKSDYIKVFDNTSNVSIPYFEGFENSGFPDNNGSDNDWTIINPGDITKFQRTTVTKKSGSGSLVLDLHSESGYDISEMWHYVVSPVIDLSSQSDSIFLDFNYAYAQQKTSNFDLLRIYASADCGENWALKKNLNYTQLITKGTTTSDFIPGISEWSSSNIDLSAYAGNTSLKIMLAMNAKGGNKLYLDNLNIYHGGLGISESLENPFVVNVYPNPIDASSVLEINSAEPNNFTLTFVDVLGKQVSSTIQLKNSKQNKINLGNIVSEFSNGVYCLRIQSGNEIKSIKIIK